MARLSPVLADGVRASLSVRDYRVPDPEGGPGLIILGPNLEFSAANQPGRAWLDQAAQEEWHRGYELPPVVLAVAGQLVSHLWHNSPRALTKATQEAAIERCAHGRPGPTGLRLAPVATRAFGDAQPLFRSAARMSRRSRRRPR